MPDLNNEPFAPAPRLARQVEAAAAEPRLRRFGAERFEPAWLSLWAMAIAREEGEPLAWLMAAANLPRALLWPGALNPRAAQEVDVEEEKDADSALALSGGPLPTLSQFERWWLWERLARPRRWPLRMQPATLRAVTLPLWLGYSSGRLGDRQRRPTRLIVLSGISGEALSALKPAVLAGLRAHAVISKPAAVLTSPADTPCR